MRPHEDDLSPRARSALDSYREATRVGDDRRAQLWSRLSADLEREDDAVALLPEPKPRRRGLWIAGGLTLAAAAAALLAFQLGSLRQRSARDLDRDRHEAAPYELGAQPERPASPRAPARRGEERRELDAQDEALAVDAPATTTTAPEREADTTRRGARGHRRPARSDTNHGAAPEPRAPAPDNALARELAVLGRARAALQQGQAERALAHLADHEREFADGQLLEDRAALRAEALCALDRAAKTSPGEPVRQLRGPAAIQAFLARYPRSAHAARVRDACGE